jgi:hypothetical protein
MGKFGATLIGSLLNLITFRMFFLCCTISFTLSTVRTYALTVIICIRCYHVHSLLSFTVIICIHCYCSLLSCAFTSTHYYHSLLSHVFTVQSFVFINIFRNDRPLVIASIADHGTSPNSSQVLDALVKARSSFIPIQFSSHLQSTDPMAILSTSSFMLVTSGTPSISSPLYLITSISLPVYLSSMLCLLL